MIIRTPRSRNIQQTLIKKQPDPSPTVIKASDNFFDTSG